MSNIP